MSEEIVLRNDELQKTQIDPEIADQFISEKHIGERIKRLRLKKSMGLVDLGRHTGLSASYLSQLETGRVVPTLRNLARIAMVFSKDLSYFFEGAQQSIFRVHRHRDRIRMPQTGAENPGYFFESLGYQVPDREMDPYFAEFVPQESGSPARAHMHPGFEFLYVLDGELCLHHGEQEAILGPSDSVYFDSGTQHSYRCAGTKPTSVLIVSMHPTQYRNSVPPPVARNVVG